MAQLVTDSDILAKLNGGEPKQVTDPAILAKLDGDTSKELKTQELKPVGRGQLPIPNSHQTPLTEEDLMNSTMMIPAMGAEAGAMKVGGMLENAATRAYPSFAKSMAEGNIVPFLTGAAKTGTAGAIGGATYGAGTGKG